MENQVKQTEEEIVTEKAKEDGMVEELDEGRKQAYFDTKQANEGMSMQIEQMQEEVDKCEQEIQEAQSNLEANPIKREAVNL